MKILKLNIYITLCLLLFSLSCDAQYNVECEDTCTHIHGLDISHYQGEVFWDTVGENSKMAYVYIKATEGGDRVDERYANNIVLAHKYGLKVGSYHFYRPKAEQMVQVENFLSQCKSGNQDLIPMIDVESKGGLSTEEFRDSLSKFLFIIENYIKQKPLIYTGANFYDHNLSGMLDDYKIMIAQYTPQEPVLKDGRDITLWQYSAKGRINGINTFVDKSRFMGKHVLRELRWRRR